MRPRPKIARVSSPRESRVRIQPNSVHFYMCHICPELIFILCSVHSSDRPLEGAFLWTVTNGRVSSSPIKEHAWATIAVIASCNMPNVALDGMLHSCWAITNTLLTIHYSGVTVSY